MSSKNHTDNLLEEIEIFLHDDPLYDVVSREKDHIIIKALEMEDGLPWGFHIARVMGRILGRVMPFGKIEMELHNVQEEEPKNDKIVLTFNITADYKELRYIGAIEVVR